MAAFLSPLSDKDSAIQTPRISLGGVAHVKMSRLWMFAMLKDRPTLAEREHIRVCATCEGAFRAALGISSFSKRSTNQHLQVTEQPSGASKEVPKAVA